MNILLQSRKCAAFKKVDILHKIDTNDVIMENWKPQHTNSCLACKCTQEDTWTRLNLLFSCKSIQIKHTGQNEKYINVTFVAARPFLAVWQWIEGAGNKAKSKN